MEQYPNYKFMSSQPQLYAFLKARYPELFEQIKARVAEGRWEPEGGMWVEADCNLTSGESLVRQFIYGKRFFKNEFGVDNRILWLPDVFGYSGALPQIMKQCGIDYFMTTKLAWNQVNKIPYDTFMWRGIDGTEVLTHLVTTLDLGQDPTKNFFTTYNGQLHPDAIMGGWQRYQQKDINNDILISYGYGDGGGGPTRDMLETSLRMEKGVEGIPQVRQVFARQFFEELDQRVSGNRRLPTWEGELYFEYPPRHPDQHGPQQAQQPQERAGHDGSGTAQRAGRRQARLPAGGDGQAVARHPHQPVPRHPARLLHP